MLKVEFKLSMPHRASWNGGWSGSEKNYVIYKNLTNKKSIYLGFDKSPERSWHYSWSDGWGARINGRIMAEGERKKKSDGFCGYDWMVDDIIFYNEIRGK